MRFIVNSIQKSFQNWNFHKVDSKLISTIFLDVEPCLDSRLDIGKDIVLCNDADEDIEGRRRISCSISLANLGDYNDEERKEVGEECGSAYLFENHLSINIVLTDVVYQEILREINFNKKISLLSVSFKSIDKNESYKYGANQNGLHTVWMPPNDDDRKLIVDSYSVSFSLYEKEEVLSFEEKRDKEISKSNQLMETIERAILYANEKTKMEHGARLFNEIKPYLITFTVLLSAIALKIIL